MRIRNNFHLQILVICLVVVGLLCAGARVPDLTRTRPHRPKPAPRLIETQQKSLKNHLRQQCDPAVALPKLQEPTATVTYRTGTVAAVVAQYVPPLFAPGCGRSPPTLS